MTNRVIILISCLILVLLFLHGYFYPKIEITSHEAKYNLQQGKYDIVVDVRTEQEWNKDHLPNTMSIPIGSLVSDLPKKIPDRSTRILFVCQKGIRASAVTVIAHKLGYNNVQSMIGNYAELL